VCNYSGYNIYLFQLDGYYWDKGGYFATIELCERDIDNWNYQDEGDRPDSPCLEAPWWSVQ
jgi:hypothetical protein